MSKRPNSFWTDDRAEELRRLWLNRRITVQDIASTLGTTVGAIVSKRKRLALGRKPKLEQRKPRKKKEVPQPRQEVTRQPRSLNLSLTQLTERTCKWPVTVDHPFKFCGCEKSILDPYCAYHLWKADRLSERR